MSRPYRGRLHSEMRLARIRAAKLARIASRPALWRGLRAGVAAAVEHAPVPFARDFGTVLDVGASRGQFALFALDRFPRARLICFEPVPEAAAKLGAVTRGRAEVHRVALGAERGTADLNVAASDDSSSLLPIGERQVEEFPGTGPGRRIEVAVERLDRYLSPALPAPRLLKVDVQGFEDQVLEGAGGSLSLLEEALVECSFVELYRGQALAGEVVARMDGHGFRLVGVHGLVLSQAGEPLQADFHFRNAGGGRP